MPNKELHVVKRYAKVTKEGSPDSMFNPNVVPGAQISKGGGRDFDEDFIKAYLYSKESYNFDRMYD